jgi:hypothetical protein
MNYFPRPKVGRTDLTGSQLVYHAGRGNRGARQQILPGRALCAKSTTLTASFHNRQSARDESEVNLSCHQLGAAP